MNIASKLKYIYRRQMFFPTFLGMIINPYYFARKGLAKHIGEFGGHISGRVLDIGCGSKPYEEVYAADEYVGLEYDTLKNRKNKAADYYYDGRKFPFDRDTFDSVVANQVFEHVFRPNEFMKEINRVLKHKGILLMTVPFVWDEHEQPYDYARYTSFGLRSLLAEHGFKVLEQRKSIDDISVIFQLINVYIFKMISARKPYTRLIVTLLMMAPVNIIGAVVAFLLPRNSDLYLDNIVLARKDNEADIQ